MNRIRRGRVVAIVDDDQAVREALTSLLRSVGHQVRVFASAEDFLASGDVAGMGCLLLDLRMPGMSGLELQARLTAAQVRIPIIFFTAHGDDDARARALRAGAVSFLRKPLNEDTLLDAVNAALSE